MVDDGSQVGIIYLDFQKAFDKVPHGKLMRKIRDMKLDNNIVKWIAEWLDGRSQRVVINGEYSDWVEVTSGVPQGSILGPILFTVDLYINDLETAVCNKFFKSGGANK